MSGLRAAVLNAVWLAVLIGMCASATSTRGGLGPRCRNRDDGWGGRFGIVPSLRNVPAFLRMTTFWRNGLLAEAASSLVVLQIGPALIAPVIGVGSFSALRAAYTVLAPVGMLIAGVAPILIVAYQRPGSGPPDALRRLAATNAVRLSALAAGYAAAVLLLPDALLVRVFGNAVIEALQLVVPIAATLTLFAAFCTLVNSLRGVVAPRRIALT